MCFHRERRAARRAALGLTEPEAEEAGRNESRQRADSKSSDNDRAHLEGSSPVNDRPRSPRGSPRPSPKSSPTSQRRKFKFDEPKAEGKLIEFFFLS